MALNGTAFLAIWNDIAPGAVAEFGEWHTREHMPERVGVPGFERGRRFFDGNRARHRYFTLYEGTTLDVFQSPAYRARLNDPTAWSMRVQPHFLNFVRSACLTLASRGLGVGGALATIRLNLNDTTRLENATGIAEEIARLEGISGAHIGKAEPSVSRVQTKESELRKLTGEDVFDAVVMVEGIGRAQVEAALPAVERILGDARLAITSSETATYDLAYLIGPEEVR